MYFKFIYLFLATLALHCCAVFTSVATAGGHYLVVMCRLLVAVASLVAEHGLCNKAGHTGHTGLSGCGICAQELQLLDSRA